MRHLIIALLILTLGACGQTDSISRNAEPFSEISPNDTITAAGTEPFWSIKILGDQATYSAPEDLAGTEFSVRRFAGNNGLGFSGELKEQKLVLTVTPGNCSDGMSETTFPYTVTLVWGDETRHGCADIDVQKKRGLSLAPPNFAE